MRRRSFYLRRSIAPIWVEDHLNVIFIGRWLHMYNTYLKRWTRVTDIPNSPWNLQVRTTEMSRISLRTWLKLTGIMGAIEILEDFVGRWFLSPYVDRRLEKRYPLDPDGLAHAPIRKVDVTEEDLERECQKFLGEDDSGTQPEDS